jgi:hypothetical protein
MEEKYEDRPNRSVNDYDSVKELERALKDMSFTSPPAGNQYVSFGPSAMNGSIREILNNRSKDQNYTTESVYSSCTTATSSTTSENKQQPSEKLDTHQDWVLENFDPETTEPQTLEDELKRLLVLKSYLLLDEERKRSFERITGLAGKMMKCPIALIGLMDLGRQWFLSTRGMGEATEASRKNTFCSHAIMGKENIMVVNDATKDPRFMNNPNVLGPPYVRFYAGATLTSPEGYKLGTLCVVDTEPRPNGVALDEKHMLMELAALAVDAAVQHRESKMKEFCDPAQMIAYTAHDILTP